MIAAVGFREHSGWAAVVALGGDVRAPRLLLRERLELLPHNLPRQPYHAVAEQGAHRRVIDEVRDACFHAMTVAVARIRSDLAAAGFELGGGAVAASAGALPPLDAILRSHMRLHAAEGDFYRETIAAALAESVPHVRRYLRADLASLAPGDIGVTGDALAAHLATLGKFAGPPWTADQKEAAIAAWVALAVGAY